MEYLTVYIDFLQSQRDIFAYYTAASFAPLILIFNVIGQNAGKGILKIDIFLFFSCIVSGLYFFNVATAYAYQIDHVYTFLGNVPDIKEKGFPFDRMINSIRNAQGVENEFFGYRAMILPIVGNFALLISYIFIFIRLLVTLRRSDDQLNGEL